MKRLLPLLLPLALTVFLRAVEQPVDPLRARELFRRMQAGEKLTDDERKYLDEARRQRDSRPGADADSPEREKMRAIREKAEHGETLNEGEKKLLAEARKRFEEGRGPDAKTSNAGNAPEQRKEAANDKFDWEKARAAHQKERRGESLNEEEKKLLDEAKKRMSEGRGPGRQDGARRSDEARAPIAPTPKNLLPLTELSGKYKDQDGGLYGAGKNEPPAEQAALARKVIAEIKPLERGGKPAADGKVVLMSIGMSNTTMEFSNFVQLAKGEQRKAAHVVVLDAAQGGKDATTWATAEAPPWSVAEERLRAAGVTTAQVQAIWIKQALKGPQAGFPAETERLRDRLREIVVLAKQKYPNLRVAYLSSRIYAGYASTPLNPEPYSYESAFAVRWLIEEQMKGAPALNANAAKGAVKAPVLLWGPYLWTNGEEGRKSDGLIFKREDLVGDGTHPSQSGREKVAKLLLDFFTTNELAKPWFTK